MMFEGCRSMYRNWHDRPLLEGEEREFQPIPAVLVNLLKSTHSCVSASRRSGVSDAKAFNQMTLEQQLLELQAATREVRTQLQEARLEDYDPESN